MYSNKDTYIGKIWDVKMSINYTKNASKVYTKLVLRSCKNFGNVSGRKLWYI